MGAGSDTAPVAESDSETVVGSSVDGQDRGGRHWFKLDPPGYVSEWMAWRAKAGHAPMARRADARHVTRFGHFFANRRHTFL